MSLDRVASVAIDTLGQLADEIVTIELSAVIAPPPNETTEERNNRRSAAVRRLGDMRAVLLTLRSQMLRAREEA